MWFDDYDLTITCEEYYGDEDEIGILPEDFGDSDYY